MSVHIRCGKSTDGNGWALLRARGMEPLLLENGPVDVARLRGWLEDAEQLDRIPDLERAEARTQAFAESLQEAAQRPEGPEPVETGTDADQGGSAGS